MSFRVGHGFDVHRLVTGRVLIIGGVSIPFDKGLKGHSDADVLLHAICDALLGAAGLGDIGRYFPDTDSTHHNRDSREFMRIVRDLLDAHNFEISNIDSTVVAQAPKLAPFVAQMESNIAADLGIGIDQVNVKATTTEGLGPLGQGQGIAAHAAVLINVRAFE
jgi:2-C-methyl-D-erythritol 2,4-cyclodiphosphate synthase